jgi:hypothetical protein
MPHVDASRRVVEATSEQQVARPKLAVLQVDNGDGTFSYYQQVYLANPTAIVGPVDVTIGGADPQVDTVNEEVIPVYKMRLGGAGVDDRLVDDGNPVPTKDERLFAAIERQSELLERILEALTE